MTQEVSQQDMAEAIDRIARTPDGAMLYRYMQKRMYGVLPMNAESCALAFSNGYRTFASELMGLMSQGIETHDRYSIVSFRLHAAEQRPGSRGAARRVSRDTFVPGFSDPESLAVPGSDPA